MADQQLVASQIDVGLDTAKAMGQSVEQRARVLVVVMGVRVAERHHGGSGRLVFRRCQGDQASEYGNRHRYSEAGATAWRRDGPGKNEFIQICSRCQHDRLLWVIAAVVREDGQTATPVPASRIG